MTSNDDSMKLCYLEIAMNAPSDRSDVSLLDSDSFAWCLQSLDPMGSEIDEMPYFIIFHSA